MAELQKIQRLRQEATVRVHLGITRLPHQLAADQSAIVMAWAAQLKPNPQSGTAAPTLRQNPTAAGIEQVTAVDQHIIDPDPDLIRPPTEHKALLLMWALKPVRRPADHLLDVQPYATSGPDQQPPLSPVRSVDCPPGFRQHRPLLMITAAVPSGQ